MTAHVMTICASCTADQRGLIATLKAAFVHHGLAFDVRDTECMSGCTRPTTLAFRAPGKMAYLFGDIAESDLPDVLIFARLYLAADDGTLADARAIGTLRTKAIARIPG